LVRGDPLASWAPLDYVDQPESQAKREVRALVDLKECLDLLDLQVHEAFQGKEDFPDQLELKD